MTTEQIQQVFGRVYKGHGNFMTPNSIRHGEKGDYIYEVSEGRGFTNEKIYGLTCLKKVKGVYVRDTEHNDCHHSIASVDEAIAKI